MALDATSFEQKADWMERHQGSPFLSVSASPTFAERPCSVGKVAYELGDRLLTADEESRICQALHAEGERLRKTSTGIRVGEPLALETPTEGG